MATDDKSWAIFDSRQGILRTIGHVSFGYQRHAHSHFGPIDGHIAICAWARFIANKARKTADVLQGAHIFWVDDHPEEIPFIAKVGGSNLTIRRIAASLK
jgi:hypothetical protein